MMTQAQRKDQILQEVGQIQEKMEHTPRDDPRRLALVRQLNTKLAEYRAVPSDEELRAQRDSRFDEISRLLENPDLSMEDTVALADEQTQLQQEINEEMNEEYEALLQEIRAFYIQCSFRYRFHCDCYRFRGLIWVTFLTALFGLLASFATGVPWMKAMGVITAVVSLAWAVWSSRPPQVGDEP